MPFTENLCSHVNETVDEKEGCVVCMDCGLVLDDKIFDTSFTTSAYMQDMDAEKNNEEKKEVKELLEKMNLPDSFACFILQKVPKSSTKKYTSKKLSYITYKTLNELGNPVSIKDISAVSGISNKVFTKMQEKSDTIILEPKHIVEKYCKILGLNYKQYTVIKEKLHMLHMISGHNPLTIIASLIYLYSKENNLKHSMKTVANIVGISCVSIQRYLKKNELSYRT